MPGVDVNEVLMRALKYVVMGLAIAVSAMLIEKSLNMEKIIVLSLTAAAVFAILDVLAPAVGSSARTGAGLGLGAKLVGFP